VAQAVLVVTVGFRVTTVRSPGPSWAGELKRVERECRTNPNGVVRVEFSPENFNSAVRCDEL
jgi:hypothetical protein